MKKTIIFLLIILVVFTISMFIRCDSGGRPVTAENFDADDYPFFRSISQLAAPFTPELQQQDIFEGADESRYRILPAPEDEDLRKARFCVEPQAANDRNGMVIIEYTANRAEERFEDLKQQACTLSVRNTERFPSCNNLMILKSSGRVRINRVRGRGAVLLNDEELVRFVQ